ncbi:ubiquitin--protein ligase [Oesophagostomum dentatum]|uniref:Ubiquitin--protein ligase n=1 Tax=Oesophagostomum dentatum TaxID=61180 RepID=A0A0B1SP50_OESDE|nr:ubiquitin--protein ligase [Oesophagostomum dentatum]
MRTTTDAIQAAASMLRFVDDSAARTVQPGQGIRGEHGVITSGRVIPMLSVDLDSTQASSSSSGESVNSAPVPTPSPPRTSPRPPTPVRRILRRKIGVAGSRSALCQDDRTELFTRLVNEEIEIQTNAPPGCYAAPKSGDLLLWTAVIEGPAGTPYEGGTFFCNIHITTRYPLAPPKVGFFVDNSTVHLFLAVVYRSVVIGRVPH